MSVELYDKSIVYNLRSLFKENVFINDPEDVLMTAARLNRDDIKLPLISLRRTGITLLNRNHTMAFEGMLAGYGTDSQGNDRIKNIQAIPIRINYLMDIWSKTRSENDAILRELIFYYTTNPVLNVKIPFDLDKSFRFSILFDDDIEDNSDVPAQKDSGVYFRQTLSFYVNDAYLWKSSSRYPVSIDIIVTTENESEDVV